MVSVHGLVMEKRPMAHKKKPRSEWLDPDAPTELQGDLNLVQSDLVHFFIQGSVDELSEMGVSVSWSKENEGYSFSAENRTLKRIAEEAYSIGVSHQQFLSIKQQQEELDKKSAGTRTSARIRGAKKRSNKSRVLKEYAIRVERGDSSIAKLSADLEMGRATVYGIIAELKKELKKRLTQLKREQPALSSEDAVAQVVRRFADTTPGVNSATVRAAMKAKR